MSSRFDRTLLMSAASALVLAAGPVLAEDGLGVDVETNVGAGASVGAEAAADAGPGVGVAVDTDAKALLGVDSTASVGDVVHTGESGADAAADADADAKLAIGANEEGAIGAEGAAAASADITAMTLAQFSGKRLHDGSGAAIGTVEAVAVDADSELYLVTALDAIDEDGQERLIPLDQVEVDAAADALVMAQGSAEAVAQMDGFAAVASAYSLVDTDAKLQALLAAD